MLSALHIVPPLQSSSVVAIFWLHPVVAAPSFPRRRRDRLRKDGGPGDDSARSLLPIEWPLMVQPPLSGSFPGELCTETGGGRDAPLQGRWNLVSKQK